MARLVLDLDAFRHNVRALSSLAAPARTMLAVKADAYGHGMIQFAKAALESGADSLAVLEVPAAISLRDAGIGVPIFAWLHGRDTDFRSAIQADIELGVSSISELDAILAVAAERPASVHLKVDTGLHRNGASPEDWPALVNAALKAEQAGHVRIAGLWSHLADASPADDAAALAEFRAAIAVAVGLGVPVGRSRCAPAPPGRELGRNPDAGSPPRPGALRHRRVRRLAVRRRRCPRPRPAAGDDADRRSRRDSGDRVVLDLGSADGIPPSVLGPSGSGAEVLLADARAAVVTVGIDTVTVRIPAGATAALGDEAIIFGTGDAGEPTAEDWASWAGTIGDEIVVRASRRIPREYLG